MLMKDRDKRIASPTKLIKRLDALDLSAYQEAGECGGDSPELTMPTMVAPIQQPASAPDVTMPTMAAPTQQPVPQQPDVTMPTMAAPTQQSAPQQPDVTMPTMGAPTQQSAPRQPDVTMPTMAAPTVQQRPVSEPSNPTVTLAAAPQTDEPRKQESGAARKTAFAKKPLIVTVAASVVVVLCVVGGLFLMKGGSSNPPSSPENVAETTRPPEVVPPPKENPSTAKTEVTKTNPPPQKPAERPKPEVTEAVPSKPEEKTEPEVVVPQPKEVKPPKKELKTLGTVDAGSVVLFGADNSRTGSLFQALAGEGSLKAVGYQEASKELKEWSAQLGEIQGRSPAFVIVAITDEKNSLAFRRMIPEMMKVLSSQNAAILVGSGDTGIYDEVKEACNANGMFFRTWASNRELVSYVLGLRSELGW
jgi:hypothetical protein